MTKILTVALLFASGASPLAAQTAPAPAARPPVQAPAVVTPPAPAGVTPPPGYVIGPEDVLTISFWRDKDMSTDSAVRPDGKITLPLLNELQAAGLTPEELRLRITELAEKQDLLEAPNVTITVKAINSRKVMVTGEVAKPGAIALMGPLTVVEALTMAGPTAYAKKSDIGIVRNGVRIPFNFKEYMNDKKGKNLKQNILLLPGDIIIVP